VSQIVEKANCQFWCLWVQSTSDNCLWLYLHCS